MKYLTFLKELILCFIPRFAVDRVALFRDEENELQVFCLEHQVMPHERNLIECYGTIKTFTWFGCCRGGKVLID